MLHAADAADDDNAADVGNAAGSGGYEDYDDAYNSL